MGIRELEAEHALAQIDLRQRADNSGSRTGAIGSASAEVFAYAGLILLALILRVAALDAAPLTAAEAEVSLAAWHIVEDDAPGSPAIASSPLLHLSQVLAFSVLGPDGFSARIIPAMAGLALALAPLLFRDSFGRTRSFIWCALLTLLTTPLVSARAADGSSFMLLFTLLAIYMVRRYWYSRRLRDASWAIVFLTFMLLLSGPSGPPLLAILLVAGWLAVWRTALSAPQRLDLPGDDILQLAIKRLREFPFSPLLLLPALVTVLVATLFMLYPAGLRAVSQLLNASISGISHSQSPDGLRLGFIALISSEPLLIIFALGGAWLLWKKGDVTYIDRFAAAWALVGAAALLFYPGAKALDAMWVVLPLTLLASYGITQLMVDRRVLLLWAADAEEHDEQQSAELYTTSYWWVKWLLSAGVFFILLTLSLQAAQVARLMLSLPAESGLSELGSLLLAPEQLRLLQSIGLLAITTIIASLVFALTANYWGLNTTLQSLGLGFCWLMLLSGLGGGWKASVADIGAPDGLWHPSAVTADAALLRETLFELAARETGGFPLLDVTIVQAPAAGISADGLVAWLLRDFPNARFVKSPLQAGDAAILLTADDERLDAISGDYVGQRFLLQRRWSLRQASLWELPAWWTQRRFSQDAIQEEALILWLRQDVYEGVPRELRQEE